MGGLHVPDDAIHDEMVRLFRQTALDRLSATFLLGRQADLNHLDGTGLGALHYAVKARNRPNIDWLQRHGADLALRDAAGNTALHYCVLLNYTDLADWFVAQTADVAAASVHHSSAALHINVRNNIGATPVHFAAQSVHLESQVAWLQRLGADFNARTTSGWRPIDFAIQRARDDNADVAAAKAKLEGFLPGQAGVGIKERKVGALQDALQRAQATRKGRRSSIAVLGAQRAGFHDGPDPHRFREDGLNAQVRRRPKGTQVAAGPRRNALEGAEHSPWKQLRTFWWSDKPPPGPPALPQILDAARLGQNALAAHLLRTAQHTAHPDGFDARGDNGKTALAYAVAHGHTKIAKGLMAAGADPFDTKGKIAQWEVDMELQRKKRAVRRAARDARNRQKAERLRLEMERAKAAERARREAAAREHERLWGSDNAASLAAQMDVHPATLMSSTTPGLSDKVTHPVTARVKRINEEIRDDPLRFFATQNVVRIDALLEALLGRMDPASGSGCSLRTDPTWPAQIKFEIPNLAWRARAARRALAKMSASHRVSQGYPDFSKVESDAMPRARRRRGGVARRTRQPGEEVHSIYDDSSSEEEELDSDEEPVHTNLLLGML